MDLGNRNNLWLATADFFVYIHESSPMEKMTVIVIVVVCKKFPPVHSKYSVPICYINTKPPMDLKSIGLKLQSGMKFPHFSRIQLSSPELGSS